MKWRLKDRKVWNRWFAWYPVRVNQAMVWLEYVERRWRHDLNFRIIHPDDRGDFDGGWEYRQ